MNDKTKNDATGSLWVTNYKYVHKNGALRTASICKTAKTATEAEALAQEELNKTLAGRYKITNTKAW